MALFNTPVPGIDTIDDPATWPAPGDWYPPQTPGIDTIDDPALYPPGGTIVPIGPPASDKINDVVTPLIPVFPNPPYNPPSAPPQIPEIPGIVSPLPALPTPNLTPGITPTGGIFEGILPWDDKPWQPLQGLGEGLGNSFLTLMLIMQMFGRGRNNNMMNTLLMLMLLGGGPNLSSGGDLSGGLIQPGTNTNPIGIPGELY